MSDGKRGMLLAMSLFQFSILGSTAFLSSSEIENFLAEPLAVAAPPILLASLGRFDLVCGAFTALCSLSGTGATLALAC